jgi:Raf kinase inhibitor-like YbhB/YbcL family protein
LKYLDYIFLTSDFCLLPSAFPQPRSPKVAKNRIIPTKTLPNGGLQGKNDFGNFGYGGPCPPNGNHRYFFTLYAIDQKLGLTAGASKKQILSEINGHVLAKAELIGNYKRQC